MIVHFDYNQPPEQALEMAACAEMVKRDVAWHKETLDSYTALNQFYAGYFSSSIGKEFERATQSFGHSALRILDVGAGRGETSFYLADQGHRVFPVEPSPDFCEVIEQLSQKFGKDLTIYNCSAEHLALEEEPFDIVVFNVSLHHCDDPVAALKNLRTLLRPGGKLLVTGDPMLPFFKTQAQWLREVSASPDETGDYGGNEHIYHYAEYVSMIRQAGFHHVKSDLVARYCSRDVLDRSVMQDPHNSDLRKRVKRLFFNLVYLLHRARFTPGVAVLKRLSLVQLRFTATG